MTYRLSMWPGYPSHIEAKHQPDTRPSGRRQYVLQHDWAFAIWDEQAPQCEYRLNIPAGFEYDGASVPRIAWTLAGIRPDGLLRAAALAHDWICRDKGKVSGLQIEEWDRCQVAISRLEADNVFLDLMMESGMVGWRAKMAYWAVRAFGPRW